MNQLPLTLAMERAEQGVESSGAHADAVEAGWRFQALSMLTAYAVNAREPFLAEAAREWAHKNGLPPPPDARAWGSVIRMASAKHRIRKAGAAPANSSNRALKHLWERAA